MRFALCLLISLILHVLVAWRISLFTLPASKSSEAELERSLVEISICERDVENAPPQVVNDAPALARAPKPPEVRVLMSEAMHEGYTLDFPDTNLPIPTIEPADLPREAMDAPEQAHVDGEATLSESIRPVYPRFSRMRGEEGDVVVSLNVNSSGTVDEVKLARSSGHTLLDEAAMKAARTARFSPAIRNGEPIASTVTLTISFRLK